MSDIRMCVGGECSLKNMCYRYTAPVNEYQQTYFFNPPIKDGKCDYFWEIKII